MYMMLNQSDQNTSSLTAKIRQILDRINFRIRKNLVELDQLSVQLDLDQILSGRAAEKAQKRRAEILADNQKLFRHRAALENSFQKLSAEGRDEAYFRAEFTRLTILGIVPLNLDNPYFWDASFHRDLLAHFESAEDFEMCVELRDKIDLIEDDLSMRL